MYFLITSLHLSFGLPIFRCPPTSMFALLHLLQSFSSHGLTISFLLLLFSHLGLCHTCPCSYFFCPDLLNHLHSHHPSQHSHTSVLSSKFCSAFYYVILCYTCLLFTVCGSLCRWRGCIQCGQSIVCLHLFRGHTCVCPKCWMPEWQLVAVICRCVACYCVYVSTMYIWVRSIFLMILLSDLFITCTMIFTYYFLYFSRWPLRQRPDMVLAEVSSVWNMTE